MPDRQRHLLWVAFSAALSMWLVSQAARDLANFRPVSNDEAELIEVGYNLATRGVLGSPMFAGFFGAESFHLWTLPMQHVLDALSFRLFGGGVAQARWVSLVAGVSILWSVGWLGLRRYGLAAAVGAELLLVFWRSNLTDGATGLPLLDVSRVARYDVLAVAFAWLAFATIGTCRSHAAAFGAGILAGLAALSQFFGIFVVPVLLITSRRRRAIITGAALGVLPWLVYVGLHLADFGPQMSVFGQRGDFVRPGFYLENVLGEPTRYGHLLALDYAWSGWLVLLGIWPALAFVVWRRDRLLAASLLVPLGLLTVFDQTKTPLYAIALVPPVCLALACAPTWCWRRPLTWWRAALSAAAALVIGWAILGEGLRAYGVDRQESSEVTPYLQMGQRIDDALPSTGLVLGPERWWWPIHARPYISLRSLWFQWLATGGTTPFTRLAERWQPTAVIVNNNVRDDVLAFPVGLQDEFWAYLQRCAEQTAELDDATYFDVQVYRITSPTGCGYTGARTAGGRPLTQPAI